jgi:hypothetical protein
MIDSVSGRVLPRRGLATFASLVLVAEVAGRSLTARTDRALHLRPLASPDASYYPWLLVGVKIAGAIVLAALLARGTRALAAAEAGERLLAALGHAHERRSPKLRPNLSPRIWFASFASTSLLYLVHADAEGIANGRWPLLAPWLHTYALPVFAVLALGVALVWRLASWLYEVEDYAQHAFARARRILTAAFRAITEPHRFDDEDVAPRRRFGLAFECRPPPLAA